MLKLRLLTLATLALLLAGLNGCAKKEPAPATPEQGLSQELKARLNALGFNAEEAYETDGGYIVEGDIFLSDADLNVTPDITSYIIGNTEQYRTTNLVTGLPRNIKVWLSTQLPSAYGAALDEMVNRYNAQGLLLTFTRVTSSNQANIKFNKSPANANYLASSGFPSGGNPYNQVLVNSTYLGSNPGTAYLATIFAHEVGHCIGFRHTDYMNRAYSCGGTFYNEGSAGIGAILIPGTPSAAEPNSFMLACIAAGQNRPFDAYDIIALNYLY